MWFKSWLSDLDYNAHHITISPRIHFRIAHLQWPFGPKHFHRQFPDNNCIGSIARSSSSSSRSALRPGRHCSQLRKKVMLHPIEWLREIEGSGIEREQRTPYSSSSLVQGEPVSPWPSPLMEVNCSSLLSSHEVQRNAKQRWLLDFKSEFRLDLQFSFIVRIEY